MTHRLRRYSLKRNFGLQLRSKLAALRAAKVLKRGGIIAHHTGTLPGVAAVPRNRRALDRVIRFKQRNGPFLVLADSRRSAARLIRHYSPELRRQMRKAWPGPCTLLVPARPGLDSRLYRNGTLALRIDGSLQARQLAKASGGLLLSSSLNRRGGVTRAPSLRMRMRWHRHIDMALSGPAGSGKASVLMRVRGNVSTIIRP